MLEVRQLSAAYGQHPALQEAALTVGKGEIVVILGANGAGKSTLLRAIAGICDGKVTGEVTLAGKSLLGLSADDIVESGVSLVPEGRGIFGDLTVKENLLLGAYAARARANEQENLQQVLSLFPKLAERQTQVARTMSGGEQQMVAIGRAMMSAPDILMLDEPSLGLAPLLCKELFQNLSRVKAMQIGILLVEQNARQSLAIADRGYLLENTRITHEDNAAKLATDPAVQKAYLGAGSKLAETTQTAVETPSAEAPSSAAFNHSVGEIRRSADQQIGASIEDIVAKATNTSATSAQSVGSVKSTNNGVVQKTSGSLSSAASSREIETITLDIEKAALDARSRAASRGRSRTNTVRRSRDTFNNSNNEAVDSTQSIHSDARPAVVEVYKRPRVEVYRRRPGGEFERD